MRGWDNPINDDDDDDDNDNDSDDDNDDDHDNDNKNVSPKILIQRKKRVLTRFFCHQVKVKESHSFALEVAKQWTRNALG